MPIAKIVKGNTAAGCLGYVLGKPDAVLHQTNCVGQSIQELSAEFDLAIQAQMQRQTRGRKAATTVYHTSIAFDLGCRLDRAAKLEIAQRYLGGMGFDRTQNAYVIAEHHDTQHQHLHIIASRVRWDGYTTPCWQDYQRAEQIMRQVEAEYGLKPVASSRESEVKAPTVAEVRRSRSTGKPIPRVVIQQAVDDCLERRRCISLAQLQAQLQAQHNISLTTKPVTTRSGQMALALLFTLQGRTYSASKLGRKYRYGRLQQAFDANAKAAVLGMEEEPPVEPGFTLPALGEPVKSSTASRDDQAKLALPPAVTLKTGHEADWSEWQNWLEAETSRWEAAELGQSREEKPPPDQVQQDWNLWRSFEQATDRWLAQKGIARAAESDGQRRLVQVALYCRLKGYPAQETARALLISPHRASLGNASIQALDWADQDKTSFALLKLMVKVDEQVWALQGSTRARGERQKSGSPEQEQT